MKKCLFVLALLSLSVAGMCKNHLYDGKIGNYPITVAVNEEGDLVYYYYNSNPNSHFTLITEKRSECSESEYEAIWDGIRPDGCFKLTVKELTPTNQVSGRFYLTAAGRMRHGYASESYVGTFVRSKDGKEFKVDFGGDYEL